MRNSDSVRDFNIPQVDLLSTNQIAKFKRDGFVILPGVLDPGLCRQARDNMWETISACLPRMQRESPGTWTPVTDKERDTVETEGPRAGGEAVLSGHGHRLFIRNGTDELQLNLAPRTLWQVAEQLLGTGTLVWPTGHDDSGLTSGPCLMSDEVIEALTTHLGREITRWPPKGTMTTETLRLPKTGPVWLNGQGTRGLYCTLPNSPPLGSTFHGAHSDGACYGRNRLLFAAYIDDVPPGCGGFTVWPGSHTRIWTDQWKAFHAGELHTDRREKVRAAGGYEFLPDPLTEQIKSDTKTVDCHGPAGTVVLWHHKILHVPGQNASNDILRQATIYGYVNTVASLPDALAMDDGNGGIWRDWSEQVRATPD